MNNILQIKNRYPIPNETTLAIYFLCDESADDDTDSSKAEKLLEQLLETDADQWDVILQEAGASKSLAAALLTAVQRTTEQTVLSLDAGSMAQRVQAEYLQEMMKRIEPLAQK